MTRPAIAYVGGPDERSDWAVALQDAGLDFRALWCPASEEVGTEGSRWAEELGVEWRTGELPGPDVAGVVVVARGPARAAALAGASACGLPVLLEAPCVGSDVTSSTAVTLQGLRILGANPLRFHPGFSRVLTSVRGAETGLLRAVAVDLVMTGKPERITADAVLRELGAQAVDLVRSLTGPATVRLQAHAMPSGGWTLLGQTDRDVVVSMHASLVPGADERPLLATVRVVGTHGAATVDLARPALQVRTPAGEQTVPYGDGGLTAMLRHAGTVFSGAAAQEPGTDVRETARVLDVIESSAARTCATVLTW